MKIIVFAAALAGASTGALAQEHQTADHSAVAHSATSQTSGLQAPGEAAFGAIQEIVDRLEADPATDWSRVDIVALREHLIDMNEVTLHASIRMEPTENGLRFYVTGAGRTREAIQRMVLDHARTMGDAPRWTMTAQAIPDGALVIAQARAPTDLLRMRALGLIGMIADGAHHQAHHWMIATGESPHS